MQRPHDKIISLAAKAALAPLGFHRKGQSRTWLADHGWWLTVVEFQPSAWSKGAYLNVAAHWLWTTLGVVSFDYGGRTEGFVEYQDDVQFAPSAACLAKKAAEEAQKLVSTFTSLSATAAVLLDDVQRNHAVSAGHSGWDNFNAGVAAALDGREREAAELFDFVLNSPKPPQSVLHAEAERMSEIVSSHSSMQQEVFSLIARQRSALRLAPLDDLPF